MQSLLTHQWQPSERLVVAVSQQFALFEKKIEESSFQGVIVDFMNAFSAKYGFSVSYVLFDREEEGVRLVLDHRAHATVLPKKIARGTAELFWLIPVAASAITPVIFSTKQSQCTCGAYAVLFDHFIPQLIFSGDRTVFPSSNHWSNEHLFDCVFFDSTLLGITANAEYSLPTLPAFEHVWGLVSKLDAQPILTDLLKKFMASDPLLLERLYWRYTQHWKVLGSTGFKDFQAALKQDLPKWRVYFEMAAAEYQLDWRWLAALAYQESRWQALAVSPLGAAGFMQFSLETGSLLGVKDRFNAKESIFAGASYLRYIKDEWLTDVEEPDKTWLALIAYNQGEASIFKSRALLKGSGLSDRLWQDIAFVLKQDKKNVINRQALIDFVQRTRAYYEILRLYYPKAPQAYD